MSCKSPACPCRLSTCPTWRQPGRSGSRPLAPSLKCGSTLTTSRGRLRPPADWVQHIPRAWQHQVTYAGHFANALGKLNPKPESQVEELADKPKSGKWVKWRTLILRSWAVDPELCPQCRKEMKRAGAWGHRASRIPSSTTLIQQHELNRLLKNLGIGLYPTRPRSPPPPSLGQDLEESQFSLRSSVGVTNRSPGQAISRVQSLFHKIDSQV